MSQDFEKRRSAMVKKPKSNAAKKHFVAGSDPILPACLRAKSPTGLRGSRPATMHELRSRVQCFAAYKNSRSCSQLFRGRPSVPVSNRKGSPMPLLKPPEPQIAMRKVANQFFSPRSGAQIWKSQSRRAAPVSGDGLEAFQQTLSEDNSGSSGLGLAIGYVSSVVTVVLRAVEL